MAYRVSMYKHSVFNLVVLFVCFFFVQFPEMVGFIHGEESNKFENGLGDYSKSSQCTKYV